MNRTLLALAAAAVLTAGCSSGTDGTDALGNSARDATTTTAASPTPTDGGEDGLGTPDPVTATTPPGPKTFPMGYRATIFDGEGTDTLRLTIASPKTVGDDYIKPERGRFLAFTVTFEALAPAMDVNPFDLIVLTDSGERLQPTFGPETSGAQLNSATLNTGEKARGIVVFDVPKSGLKGIAYAPVGQVLGTWSL